jgi:hypothetical protein
MEFWRVSLTWSSSSAGAWSVSRRRGYFTENGAAWAIESDPAVKCRL